MQKTNLWLPGSKGQGGGETGIDMYTLPYINNKDLPYSTGNYIQYLGNRL